MIRKEIRHKELMSMYDIDHRKWETSW